MKNRRIHFDDRFYYTVGNLILSIGSSIIYYFAIVYNLPIFLIVTWPFVILVFIVGIFTSPKSGILFNYELGIIKYFGPHKIKKKIINMNEVEKIEFSEIKAENRGRTDLLYYADMPGPNEIDYVYSNGKLFKFYIHIKDGDIIEIPYQDLYRVTSKLRVQEQVERIRKILKEFNTYIANKKE